VLVAQRTAVPRSADKSFADLESERIEQVKLGVLSNRNRSRVRRNYCSKQELLTTDFQLDDLKLK